MINVLYRQEEDGWWADSADLKNFVAVGENLLETRKQIKEGLPFFCGQKKEIIEQIYVQDENENKLLINLSGAIISLLLNINYRNFNIYFN